LRRDLQVIGGEHRDDTRHGPGGLEPFDPIDTSVGHDGTDEHGSERPGDGDVLQVATFAS
jgi:hypothetical protein